ncbi:MAG: PEP/pyruvate-binding domain-containing protein, partial [Planctomycetota bacterium]|nr:PEP/pyruvate-binding domain-containing protein [Planctomycetota bacterium]
MDRALRGLLPGDNIVWRIESADDYAPFIEPYRQSAVERGRGPIYFRFGRHAPLLPDDAGVETHRVDPNAGFEAFISEIHSVIQKSSRGTWFVFDCLSDLAVAWRSDTMLGNFFVLTCPYLFDVDAIAYFGLKRDYHSDDAIAPIMATTQVFLDIYRHEKRLYVHPVKVQQRHSDSMYMLHAWMQDDFMPVRDSATTAEILNANPCLPGESQRSGQGVWHRTFRHAEEAAHTQRKGDADKVEPQNGDDRNTKTLRQLLETAVTRDREMLDVWMRYLSIGDVLDIGRRIIGTGLIGGKTVGMLLARAILRRTDPQWAKLLEVHDSFYIGSDVFYTFLVQNGLWWTWQKHHNPKEYLLDAEHARRRILVGKFADNVRRQFRTMLHYFGQSPIIVRSSSLLEDSFQNSFAGKYDSIFLANQGSPEQRLQDFMAAVRAIYASTLSEKALTYRARRGMLDHDEQMALLVQRVSGEFHEGLFFPQLAGVGFSYNPYVWSDKIDPKAGVLRLVFGLGTRAVDRTDDDYPRVIALNAPERRPVAGHDGMAQYTQRRVDVLDLQANQFVTENFCDVARRSSELPYELFVSDAQRHRTYQPGGQQPDPADGLLTFDGLLKKTDYVAKMREMLAILEKGYGCPVDVEFTTNIRPDGSFLIDVVQCRPLHVQSDCSVVAPPEEIPPQDLLFRARDAIMGRSRVSTLDRIIYVVPRIYGQLPLADRYTVARLVGKLCRLESTSAETSNANNPPGVSDAYADSNDSEIKVLLLGPGRWGTSMPSLGVPVTFHEISSIAVLGEIVAMHDNLIPDVSLGTHFFNELVEADILYFALFPGRENNSISVELFESAP